MLDSHLHPRLKPLLNAVAGALDRPGISPDGLTLVGFAIGVLALPFLALGWYGADGVKMQCDLLSCQNAGWQGVTLNTTRGHFYRAALEGLTAQLQRNLQMLEKIGHFKASELLLVGGGSRNTLWNQIKANMLDIPVKVLDDAETTVAGAALFGWYGVGEFNSPEEARAQIHYQYRYFYPQTEPEFIEEV